MTFARIFISVVAFLNIYFSRKSTANKTIESQLSNLSTNRDSEGFSGVWPAFGSGRLTQGTCEPIPAQALEKTVTQRWKIGMYDGWFIKFPWNRIQNRIYKPLVFLNIIFNFLPEWVNRLWRSCQTVFSHEYRFRFGVARNFLFSCRDTSHSDSKWNLYISRNSSCRVKSNEVWISLPFWLFNSRSKWEDCCCNIAAPNS